ncbi:MAG: hypothetical protein COA78_15045 [Blastopirellula sp.]|nr:MAG: hypothetical protein COA78_15045 [Blastopirellula sp.]
MRDRGEIETRDCKTNEVMEKLSALKPRRPVLCPERLLFDERNGTWLVETIRASGQVCRVNRPDTRLLLTMYQSQKRTCKKGAIHTGQTDKNAGVLVSCQRLRSSKQVVAELKVWYLGLQP